MFTTELDKIDLAPFVLLQRCAELVIVSANSTDFQAMASSRIDSSLPVGYIHADRKVEFVDKEPRL